MKLRNFFLSSAVVTMANAPKIEKRLRAILEAGQRPNGGAGRRLGRAGIATAALFALAAFGSLALLRPVAVRAQQSSENAPGAGPRTDEDRRAKQTACLNNLRLVGQSLAMYMQDYDETLPPLSSNAALKNRLRPYVLWHYKNEPPVPGRTTMAFGDLPPLASGSRPDVTPIFTCPETKQPYLPIAALGEKGLNRLSNPASTMVMRDAAPHPGRVPAYRNGLWNIVYADGHVKAEGKVPAIPPLRPIPPAVQRAIAVRDRERAMRRRLQERLWQQKQQRQQQRRGANAVRPQSGQALRTQYMAEVTEAHATLASITELQQERGRAGDERLSAVLEQQSAAARIRLAFAQAQLAQVTAAQVQQDKRDFIKAALRHNQLARARQPRTFLLAYGVPADGKTHRLRIEVGDASGSINTAIAENVKPGTPFQKQVTARGSRVTLRLYDNDALKYERTQ